MSCLGTKPEREIRRCKLEKQFSTAWLERNCNGELRSKKLKGMRQMMSGERQRGRATQGHTSVQLLWTKATVNMAGTFGWATTAKATY